MKKLTQTGWLMSLRNSPDSNWGSIESFLNDVTKSSVDGRYIFESQVWGRVNTKELLPQKGQGIGFYHSTRARFPTPDAFGRKPRITLIGELLDVELEGKEVTYIKVGIDKEVLENMRIHPIVRDEEMAGAFEECGIMQGSVATFYYAAPRAMEANP